MQELLFKIIHEKRIHIMASVQADITINVSAGAQPLTVDASGVPNVATAGQPYNGVLKASGGTPPYSFAVTSGAVPDGLALNSDGTITGSPAADSVGADEFVVTVTDSAAVQASARVGNRR